MTRLETDIGSGTTLHDAFEHYERRFAAATAHIPSRLPWVEEDRSAILSILKKCLRIRDEWVPTIKSSTAESRQHPDDSLECLQFTSWPGCYGAAYLYAPRPAPTEEAPMVLIACGHGAGGKLAYRALGEQLARCGIFALIPDNIGQGERATMGHREASRVFAAGLSVQGLIVMETMGWLNWIQAQRRFDRSRIAIVGNSGGGTLAHLVGALCRSRLAAVSSSGYPSSYAFIHRKEKKLCHCNVIPKIVGALEMWQVYGCIAPTPLFLFQGREDPLFPQELFWQAARKVHGAFLQKKAATHFKAEVFEGGHSWDEQRMIMLVKWLSQVLGMPADESLNFKASTDPAPPPCFDVWPGDAITIDELAESLSGVSSQACHLADVFPPAVGAVQEGASLLRAKPADLFAQFEAALSENTEIEPEVSR